MTPRDEILQALDAMEAELAAVKAAALAAANAALAAADAAATEIARLRALLDAPPPPPAPDLVMSFAEPGLQMQAKDLKTDRIKVIDTGALQLTTLGADINVSGSGTGERADMHCGAILSVKPGDKFWLAHSVILADNFPLPIRDWAVFFNFHHASGGGQANVQLGFRQNSSIMAADVNGGATIVTSSSDPGHFQQVIDPNPQKNVRYDFTWYFEWSSNADGLTKLWMRKGNEPIGKLVATRLGANLYAGVTAYLKLANYHSPAEGRPVTVTHFRVMKGKVAAAVALTPLEGV